MKPLRPPTGSVTLSAGEESRWAALTGALLTCVLLAGCAYFPRMNNMPNVRPYLRPTPGPPANSIPRGSGFSRDAGQAHGPAPTGDALVRGRIYYGYYCRHCHGDTGKGDLPVGESYHPAPTDLTSPAVQSKSDADLIRAMVTGVGHEPVLDKIVPPERRWLIVAHVRTLARPRR